MLACRAVPRIAKAVCAGTQPEAQSLAMLLHPPPPRAHRCAPGLTLAAPLQALCWRTSERSMECCGMHDESHGQAV